MINHYQQYRQLFLRLFFHSAKDKWMSVDIYYEKGILSMEIKNSFQHELAVEKNKLLSTKEEKGHGIGLANVRKMVEKYQGFMDVSNTNQIFTVKVMLYL